MAAIFGRKPSQGGDAVFELPVVHRGDPGGSALNPAESLTPLQALRASVDGGRIIEGAAADLVLLGDDPLTVGPSAEQASRLRDMTTRLTLCAGRITSGA